MKGQGTIEAIYSIGILGMVLTGVVILILMTITNKKNDFDRKKATELGTMVMEEQISSSKNDSNNFWNLTNIAGKTKPEFVGYVYSIGYSNISSNASYPNCGVTGVNCAEVVVKIDWQGKNPQSIFFNRFFSKNGN